MTVSENLHNQEELIEDALLPIRKTTKRFWIFLAALVPYLDSGSITFTFRLRRDTGFMDSEPKGLYGAYLSLILFTLSASVTLELPFPQLFE